MPEFEFYRWIVNDVKTGRPILALCELEDVKKYIDDPAFEVFPTYKIVGRRYTGIEEAMG